MDLARSAALTLSLFITAWSSTAVTRGGEPSSLPRPDIHRGRELFERVWTPDKTANGDGLGPMFNERSCVACHSLGGIGGGGPNSKNVDLLSLVVPQHLETYLKNRQNGPRMSSGPEGPAVVELERKAERIHFALRGGSIMLHTYGTDPRYSMLREQALGLVPTAHKLAPSSSGLFPEVRRPPGADPVRTIKHGDLTLQFSQRNSSAMFGAGLIDRISQADIQAAADEQARRGWLVSGRPLGRFGWRGQTKNLTEFVKGACVLELGLDVQGIPQPQDPVRATLALREQIDRSGPRKRVGAARPRPVVDLDEGQLRDLTAFTASLPAPGRRTPIDSQEAEAVRHGEQVFKSVRCAECHRPDLGTVSGIYSDLLVHSMGQRLDDPQPVPPQSGGTLYYSSVRSLGQLVGLQTDEWRTPPLWGLADSAPYLHDGRAPTIADAVLWHGGEAQESLDMYVGLKQADRDDLHLFLSTFVAPDAPELKQPLVRVIGGSDSNR
jgi:CxxC motif-containing protein (DUF1111 family)